MIYRKLDLNNDYVMGRGSQTFLTSTQAVIQAIETRLKMLINEWWEDTAEGIPLFQSILGQNGQPENIHSIDLLFQDRILGTPDVISIVDFSSIYFNRTYTLNCTVNTTYGVATLEVTT